MPARDKHRSPVLALVLVTGALGGVGTGLFFALVHDLPQIRSLEACKPLSVTRIYSSDGVLLDEWFTEKRDPVALSAIPRALKDALIATEDRAFYRHSALHPRGLIRAAWHNIRAGQYVEGASTITQQLAKTLFLTPEKSLRRKIKEALLALQLERRYTKDEILELYLNQVYFGSGAYGVEAAARTFFGKGVGELTLAECALIAGMPKSPSRYSPLVDPGLATKRRDLVLHQMAGMGFIGSSELEQALGQQVVPFRIQDQKAKAPHFVAHVRSFLEENFGSARLQEAGLTVRTSLDWRLQQQAEAAVREGLGAVNARISRHGLDQGGLAQGAFVCLEVTTGRILAMVGGKDVAEGSFNRASMARRQPGSAFKPILYALAIEKGMTQSDLVLDAPVVFSGARGGKPWTPRNSSTAYEGEISLRRALALSQNIPAVRLIEELGPENVGAFGRRMGIASPLRPGLSLALGTSEVTLLELAAAYNVFPNRGQWVEPCAVVEVQDRNGRSIWEAHSRKRAVMSRAGAAIMVDMLQAVIHEGTARKAAGAGRRLAGKTGTTDDCKDALFVGFSPSLTMGVWVGRDNNRPLGKGETGAAAALPIWLQVMEWALDNGTVSHFDAPEDVTRVLVDPASGRAAEPQGRGAVQALFKKGTEPFVR